MVKKIQIKRLLCHFSNLAKHATRPYEPTPAHLKKRLLSPLCEDIADLLNKGIKNDFQEALSGISEICKKYIQG
ncbi:MAG: hypothetical protein HWN66_13125 [Candidatus Helarchaeota archaeon]|nr:hypothetical protein [Candidatus Helarchaeota archaeon]